VTCAGHGLSELHAVASRAIELRTARFRFTDTVPGLGAEPLDRYEGKIDLRTGDYLADDRRVVDGVLYA
jgi:hypothetical protein